LVLGNGRTENPAKFQCLPRINVSLTEIFFPLDLPEHGCSAAVRSMMSSGHKSPFKINTYPPELELLGVILDTGAILNVQPMTNLIYRLK